MRTNEAKNLRVGDRVVWTDEAWTADPAKVRRIHGVVDEVNAAGIGFRWEDGEAGFIHPCDCDHITLVPTPPSRSASPQ